MGHLIPDGRKTQTLEPNNGRLSKLYKNNINKLCLSQSDKHGMRNKHKLGEMKASTLVENYVFDSSKGYDDRGVREFTFYIYIYIYLTSINYIASCVNSGAKCFSVALAMYPYVFFCLFK